MSPLELWLAVACLLCSVEMRMSLVTSLHALSDTDEEDEDEERDEDEEDEEEDEEEEEEEEERGGFP